MDSKEVIFIIVRYLILILLGTFNLYLFYFIFTPLTVFPTFFFLEWLYDAVLISVSFKNPGAVIFVKGFYASIIPACVAGAAYYFLLILNLTTPMSFRKRVGSILFLLLAFLALNIARIVIFASIISEQFQYFNQAHTLTWYFGSTVLVIIIWFVNVFIFKIKDIPIFTDLRKITKDIF